MTDATTLRELVDKWRRKASEQGAAPYGSLSKAEVYRDCAEELERLLDEGAHTAESKRRLREMFKRG